MRTPSTLLIVVSVVVVAVFCGASTVAQSVDTLPSKSMTVESADRLADGVASVNAPLCKDPNAFGTSQRAAARIELAYLTGYRFRHVRDGFLTCYHPALFYDAWHLLSAAGAGMLATELFSYTDQDISGAHSKFPGIEALSAGNEWDVETVQEILGKSSFAGDRTISTRPFGLALHMVSGQTYAFNDAEHETFTIARPISHETALLEAPLRYAHLAGTQLVRIGDFVSDIDDWLAYYAPRLRDAHPSFPVLGASLAFPIHAEAFSQPTDRRDGRYGLDAVEEHGYPAPMGSNPEGPDGDGNRSYIGIDHPPCSLGRSSYSMQFNRCEETRQTGSPALPIWETEYSYQVVPDGAAPLLGTPHPIPDKISILYLVRSELFAAAHGRTRMYWFQMLDGTDGPKSGFCSYGLIYTGLCGENIQVGLPKGELLALGNLISFFSDRDCRFPNCVADESQISASWSDPTAPFNASAFRWKNGKVAFVAWLGDKSYDFGGGSCATTTSCFLHNAQRSVTLSSPVLRSGRVETRTFDIDPNDPRPPQSPVKSADGSSEMIAQCPAVPPRNYYGCLTSPKPIAVSRGTILLSVSDDPVILTTLP